MTHSLSIEHYSCDGYGIGYYDAPQGVRVPVEVPYTIPGEEVLVQLGKKRKGVRQGFLEAILKPAKERVEPRCLHFGECGGCRWQHIPYEVQLQYKEAWVRHCLATRLTYEVEVHETIPCVPPWEYRNKMEFSFSEDKAGERYLGLIKARSRGRVVQLKECHLCPPWFYEALDAVRAWWIETGLKAYHPASNRGSLRTLTVREGRRSGDRLVMLTVSGNPDYALPKHTVEMFVAFLRDAVEEVGELSVFVRIQQAIKGQETQFYEMHLSGPEVIRETLYLVDQAESKPREMFFQISPSAFFQPNTEQAEKLYSAALQMAGVNEGDVVYDLYCGTGTLGISVAPKAKQVIGIEISPEAILDAKVNAEKNGVDHCTFIAGDVADVLQKVDLPKADVVMIDPPRAGLTPAALDHVLQLEAPKVVYVSCNPKTQGANIEYLTDNGYRLKELQMVDQFPQTVHVETCALLVRGE